MKACFNDICSSQCISTGQCYSGPFVEWITNGLPRTLLNFILWYLIFSRKILPLLHSTQFKESIVSIGNSLSGPVVEAFCFYCWGPGGPILAMGWDLTRCEGSKCLQYLELWGTAPQLAHVGQGSSVVLCKAQLLKLLKLNLGTEISKLLRHDSKDLKEASK